ncbi:hypothetical protein ACS8E9_13315 [Pseudomonas neustonica]|uniref:Uncharacterized protein n=1 Tax=Pseudomonas neustonica TaxID=2487346 RepID=A0ABX9XGG6_9PSED|nr:MULTISPECIES: hypothetical protein [Pseudomonas]ROZ81800.1 hypothetical protein EF099_13610 [Pseudomonas sp. SSM44]ROZ83643.1 hypothetical protein EF096_12365 [Pseudomonas neustonica]|tara:strand:- start:111 stop:290 length:180 start_codon:yes stop_codon:yes gene_type:complete
MRNLSALIVASFLASSPIAQADDSKQRTNNLQGSSTSQSSTASASAGEKTEQAKDNKPA